MFDVGYQLNHNGIQFHTDQTAMPSRDQLGRYLGEEAKDDELVEYVAGGSYDPTDDIIACLDGELPYEDDDDTYASYAEQDRYGLPEEDEVDRWLARFCGDVEEDVVVEVETDKELSTYADNDYEGEGEGGLRFLAMKYSHDDKEPLMPSQSGSGLLRESSAEVLHRPVGYDMTWLSLGDLRMLQGRSHHNDKRLWWKQLADVRRQNKTYDLAATNTFSAMSSDFFGDLIAEDIENGDVVIDVFRNDYYYEHLLVANSIILKLRAHWLYEYGETDNEAYERLHYDFYRFDDEVDTNNQSYYAGEFHRKPVWDYMWGEYLHQGSIVSHHGWQGYEEELRMDAIAELHLGDMNFRDAMNDDYAQGLDMFLSWRDNDEEVTEILSQHGGPRGWKAAAVSTERLMDATI